MHISHIYCILLHIIAYYCILLHIIAYFTCIFHIFIAYYCILLHISRAYFTPRFSTNFQLSPLIGSAASEDQKFPPPSTDLFREKHYNHGGVWSPKSPLLVGISALNLVTKLNSHSCMQRGTRKGAKILTSIFLTPQTTIPSVVAQITPSSGNISLKFGHKTRLTFLHAEGNKKRGQNIDINLFFAFLKVLIL